MEITMTKKQKIIADVTGILAKKSNSVAWGISIVMIIASGLFLYNNFYHSLGDINVLTALKSQVATRVVNMELWDKISEQTAKKKEPLGQWGTKYIPF